MNELLDAAYSLRKESAKNPAVELRNRFPKANESDLKVAWSRALALIKAACEKVFRFSETVYKDAESWDLHLTK